jgi:hypothetical protein
MTYPRYRLILAWLFLCLLASPSAAQADNAIAEYQAIHQKLRAARANHDWSASLASASDLNQLLNGSPNSLLETLGDPTHGVIIGNDFYYIANSGWDVIDDQGNLKPGAQPSNAMIMRVPLSAEKSHAKTQRRKGRGDVKGEIGEQ